MFSAQMPEVFRQSRVHKKSHLRGCELEEAFAKLLLVDLIFQKGIEILVRNREHFGLFWLQQLVL